MINFFGPVNPTGYGVHSTNFIAALSKLVDIRLFLKGNHDYNGKHKETINKLLQVGKETFNRFDTSICLWHGSDMATFCGSPRIAYTVFEIDKLRTHEVSHLGSCDRVWVPSKWAQEIVQRDLANRYLTTAVVPEGVDTEMFPYTSEERSFSRFRLLNIGKFEVRKGHLQILEWLKKTKHPVDFIGHWYSMFMAKDTIHNLIKSFGFKHLGMNFIDSDELTPQIMCDVFGSDNSPAKLWMPTDYLRSEGGTKSLINQANAGVFPYSAEGWNLPLMECMASGLPCIATMYSGPTEFLTPDNAMLLMDYNMMPAQDGVFFHGDGQWAAINPNELEQAINDIIEIKSIRQDIRTDLKTFGEQWTWDNAAQIAVKELEGVL